jgi:hypothetical protein
VRICSLCVILLSVAGVVGCSANPYYGSTPAPPDRLHAFIPPPPVTPMEEAMSWGTTGCVPIGDGSEDVAPNYSGYIPPLGNQ